MKTAYPSAIRRVATLLIGLAVPAMVIILLTGGPAQAVTTVTLSTADNPLAVPDPESSEPFYGYNQDWYSSSEGHNGDGYHNTNYSTGWSIGHESTRSSFTFHMGPVTRSVTAAELRIPRGCAASPNRTERVRFWDVTTTPVRDLVTGRVDVAILGGVYRDLGSGTEYATKKLSTAPGGSAVVRVKVNAQGIAALNKARGTEYFSFGAALSSIGQHVADESVFGCTGPEPVTLEVTMR